MTLISAGQSLLDLALQEGGSLEALFELHDAYLAQHPQANFCLTDMPPAGASLTAPDPVNADLAAYFAARHYRLNTGDVPPVG